jgi:hypothetical protein
VRPDEESHAITSRLGEKLPWKLTPEHQELRDKQWLSLDASGNGKLTLSELSQGTINVMHLPKLFDAKPVLKLAFKAAKGKTG